MNSTYTAITCFLMLCFLAACEEDNTKPVSPPQEAKRTIISGADISSYPEIALSGPEFFDLEGKPDGFLSILKENGINTIRIRLWVDPAEEHSGFQEVEEFSRSLKALGFKTWLTIHYSDTWADPGKQVTPKAWQGISFESLKDSVYRYTEKVVRRMHPDYVQIGNEINSGFLHPYGNISQEPAQFKELLQAGISAVRTNSRDTELIMHFAGLEGADWFFELVKDLDYDIIGISYYPKWHGTSLDSLRSKMQYLVHTHDKPILIAETAYPFTMGHNDQTNNIVGLDEYLILPDFPATPEGQRKFIRTLREMTLEMEQGIGICYWGAELIAWKGTQSQNGSPWENQAFFDFQNKALPVLQEFKME